MGKIIVGGVVAVNEYHKMNDTPGGFGAWAEKLFTVHGATAEVIDIVATVAFVRWVGWARAVAYESASEKFGDDDWSTNVGTLAADWAFGPVAAPVETEDE